MDDAYRSNNQNGMLSLTEEIEAPKFPVLLLEEQLVKSELEKEKLRQKISAMEDEINEPVKESPPVGAVPVMWDSQNMENYSNNNHVSRTTFHSKTPKPRNHQLDDLLRTSNEVNNALLSPDTESTNMMNNDIALNDWTKENTETIRKWQSDIEKTSFVYGEILAGITVTMQRILIAVLVINAIMTLFSALSVALAFLDKKWVPIGFNIGIGLGAAAVTIMTGIVKIYGWEAMIRNFAKFTEKLDNTWFAIETELTIPPDQRFNAKDFIKRYDGEYMHLMRQCPPITGDDYSNANRKYKERLFSDHMWSLKFKQRIREELQEINVE